MIDIFSVDSIEEALAIRKLFPDALLMGMGELGGPAAEGFDSDNSPVALMDHNLFGRHAIQCTPNGTPGIVRSIKAETLLASSFPCARATADYLMRQSPTKVTFVITGGKGEDQDCAEYIAALLRNETPDAASALGKIRDAALKDFRAMISEGIWTEEKGTALEADLACCLSLDLFDFTMLVQRKDGLLVMEAVY